MTSHRHTNHDIPREIEDAFALYFDNQATPEVCQIIHDWLEEDANHTEVFAEYATIERMIYTAQKTEDASAVFALLQEAESHAEAEPAIFDHPSLRFPGPNRSEPDDTVTIKKVFTVLSIAGLDAIRKHAVVISGVAAALVLAVVLGIVLIANNDDPTAPIAAEGSKEDTPTTLSIVATLTAEHNAAWDRRPGQDLYAGQRFTLTRGTAEFTTRRGAVAIIQAPASLELLDHDNALYLHTGKLVGICETQSSKGFLVRTPAMEVIDLGTWFGIDVVPGHSSKLHVLDGRVAARPVGSTAADSVGETIVAGQSALIVGSSNKIQKGTAEPSAFAFGLPPEMLKPTRIVDDFEQLNPGVPGQLVADGGKGWAGPWSTNVHNGMKLSLENASENPLQAGSRRYLKAVFENADGPSMASVVRPFDRFGKVDRTEPHTVRFLVRAANPLNIKPDSSYRLSVYDSTRDRPGTSAVDTWMLTVFSNPESAERDSLAIGENKVAPMSWSFYDPGADYKSDTFNYSQLKDTGVALVPGQTCTVEVRVNPQAAEWDFTIKSGSERYDSREALGRSLRFRSGTNEAGGKLHFNLRHDQPGAENRLDIDDVQIEVLPDSISLISTSLDTPIQKRFLMM